MFNVADCFRRAFWSMYRLSCCCRRYAKPLRRQMRLWCLASAAHAQPDGRYALLRLLCPARRSIALACVCGLLRSVAFRPERAHERDLYAARIQLTPSITLDGVGRAWRRDPDHAVKRTGCRADLRTACAVWSRAHSP